MNMYTEMYATVDLHNLMHFINLRLQKHAQYEIQVYARAMLQCMKDIVPITANMYIETLLMPKKDEYPLL
jgi:thymidylate synthase (FAD)